MGKRRAKSKDTGRPGFVDSDGNFVELDWNDGSKQKGMDPARVKQIGITAGLGVLLIGALIFLYTQDFTAKKKRAVTEIERSEPEYGISRKAAVDTTKRVTALTFSTDILKLDRLVYTGIRLVLESGQTLDKTTFGEVDLSKVNVKLIEILVRAIAWDQKTSDARIDLLFQTYRTLKSQYPDIARVVRLVFDDKRKSLDFEFDQMFSYNDKAIKPRHLA